ncbi:CDP-glycerol glycerophosphotransferase family protein [Atopococcus tabaci]|uniref:CDP-glycerol glycerophosphotransferase family protein n=1 Tax=Atopococcus tabaci TaxID=269774 RepID=UPI0004247730|nr:CDP-glycerol glycerophosphotransferase family protein [Atopococcus tabaci]
MNYIVIVFLRIILKIFYVFPIKRNKILYMAYSGRDYTCNPKYIHKYLLNQDNGYQHVWVLKNPDNPKLKATENTETIPNKGLSFLYHFLTSKVIISNASIPTYVPLRKKQKYIETWHGGGAYKQTGLSYNQSKEQIKKLEIISEEVDLFISSSNAFTETKSKNHLVDKEKFFEIGMPRNDILFEGSDEIKRKVKDFYGLDNETKIVLYAPTYRTKEDDSSYEWLDMDNLVQSLEKRFGGQWVVFTRMHYYLNEKIQYEGAINVSAYDDMQELMLAADVLITDYSSVMWDFSITKKPAFVFAPDLEEYDKARSFFTPPEKWPFQIARTNQDLAEKIAQFDQKEHETKIKKHHQLQGSFEKGTALEKVYDKITAFVQE